MKGLIKYSIMNYQLTKYFDPWEHLTVDNLYDASLFSDMQKELVQHVRDKKVQMPLNFIEDFSDLPMTKKCIDSHLITEEWVANFSKVREYESLTPRHQVIVCLGASTFDVHYEHPKKVLSSVTYVWSNAGTGTLIYDTDKEFVKEVEWEENRTLMFCGLDDTTWHSYYSKPRSIRITLNTFLER